METYNVQTPPPLPSSPTNDERNIAMLTHLLALFSSFLGPLIIYLVKKDESPFIRDNARNVLNFQISLFIYYLVGGVLCMILIGIPIVIATSIMHLVCCIIGAVKANGGIVYKYPLTITFIK